MWATRPEPRQHFWKIAGAKNFWLPAVCPRNTTQIRFGKAGAHPQLALGIAIAPETLFLITTSWFERQLRFLRFSLRFLFSFIVQFHLLRKCGLLAHTSPTFLKNCWIKKLFSCLRLSICSHNILKKACFYTIFGRKKGLILCQLQSIIQIHFKISYCGEVARSCNKAWKSKCNGQ